MGGHLSGGLLIGARSGIRRPGAPAVPPTPPFPVAGLTGRARADSIAQADGSTVITWPGLVGGNATQPISGKRPSYKASGINGKPTVLFSRTSVTALNWAGMSASTDPFGLFIVFQSAAAAGSAFQALLGSPTAGALCVYARLDNNRVDLEKNNTGTILQSVDSFFAAGTPVAGIFNYGSAAGATGAIYRNGSSYGVANLISRALVAGTTTIGEDSQFPGAEFNGQIAEIAKWDHQLDATERAQLFAYTLDRYGI